MISECRNGIKKNAQDAKAECFLCIFCFFIGNFSFPIKKQTLREDAHLAEKKLAANSTARARKSRKRLFVHLSRATTYCFTDRKKSDLLVDQASFEFRFTINAAINPSVAVCQFERVW